VRGRLNLFQASMLRWRDLHPYNAVHVIRIPAPLSKARLEQAIDAVLEGFGLTGLELDVARRRYEWRGGVARTSVRVAVPDPDPARTVDAEIERELNAPFPRDGRVDPFRFFLVDRGPEFDLALGYDHFIAAGDSIVLLLKAIADRYAGAADGALAAPAPERYPPTYGPLFLHHLGAALAGLRRIPAIVGSSRRAFRPQYPHGSEPYNAFTHVRVGRTGVAAMLQTSRAWGVTLNDLVLALLLQTLSPLAEARHREPRRNELAIASIVNIRGDCGAGSRGAFGQFLSSFLVTHPVPAAATLEELARDVGRETGRIKRERLYFQTLFALAASGGFWRLLSPERRARFHRKAYPVWAGTTSLNVDALWSAAPGAAPVPEYIRAVPTGPLAPLVVAVTTAGGRIVLGISYRTAAFTRADMDNMAASIRHSIASLP
jgi:hypothetical protein